MIVIVDGMRGSGKTTLVKEVVNRLIAHGVDAIQWKAERTDAGSPYEGMLESIKQFDMEPFKVFCLDRFHLTEYVMSTYLQRVPLHELLTTTKTLDSLLSARHAKCVILDATYDTIDNRMALREGTRKLDMPVLNAKNLWAEALALSRIAVKRHNNTWQDFDDNANFLVQCVVTELSDFRRES